MGSTVGALVVFLLCFSVPALCQFFSFNPQLSAQQTIGTTVVHTVSTYPGYDDVILIFEPSPDYTITPSEFAFNSSVTSSTFSLTVKTTGTIHIVAVLNGTYGIFYSDPSAYKYVQPRYLDFSKGYTTFPPSSPVLAVPSNPFAVTIAPPTNDVTVNIGSDPAGAVTFTPNSFAFTPSTLKPIPFTIVASTTGNNGAVTAYVTFSGTDAAWYYAQNYTIYPVTRQIVPSAAYTTIAPVKPGQASQDIRVSLQYPPLTSVTLTPYADGITFTPPALAYTAATDSIQFSFVAATAGSHVVSWTLSGPDAGLYSNLPNKTINIATRTFDVTLPALTNYAAGGKSDKITISTQYPPTNDVTVTLTVTSTCTPAAATAITSPTTLTFNANTLSNSFVISSDYVCSGVTVTATLSGTDKDLYSVPYLGGIYYYFNKLSLASFVNTDPNFSSLQCGDTTTFTQTVNTPPPNGFSVSLSAPGATFAPSTLAFTAASLTQTFTVTSTYYQPNIAVHYTVSGVDVPLISSISDQYISVARKTVTTPTGNLFATPNIGTLLASSTSAPVEIKLNYAPHTSLTITPTATGLTFSPATITFTPADKSLFFQVTAPAQTASSVAYTTTYTLSGADAGCFSISTTTTTITATKGNLELVPNYFSTLTVGVTSPVYTIGVDFLVGNVVITPTAVDNNNNPIPNVYTFNPPQITLSPTSPSAGFTYTASSIRSSGSDQFVFQVSGGGAGYVAPITYYVGTIQARTFKTPNYLYSYAVSAVSAATLVQGIESPAFTVTVMDVPLNSVSLIPYEVNSVFNPSSLTFDATTKSASFTIKSLNGVAGGLAKTITWTLDGPGASLYTAPAANSYLAVKRDIKISQVNTLSGNYVYVGTPIPFTIVTPYPPANPLTITLSAGSEIRLDNTALTIDSTTTTATFTATANVKGTNLPIRVALSGLDADKYVQIPDINLYTQKSTFSVTLPTTSTGTANLVYGEGSYVINIRPQTSPLSSVTITVYSSQVTISPSSYTFTPGDESHDFALQPVLSAFPVGSTQTVALTFVVSGADVGLYDPPGDRTFSATTTNPLRKILINNGQTYIYVSTGPTSFSIASTVPADSSVTITPTVPQDAEFLFDPPSVTLTSGQSTAIMSVRKTTTGLPRVTFPQIVFSISGQDAYLYSDPGAAYIYAIASSYSFTGLSDTTTFVVNQPKTFPIALSAPAGAAFQVIPTVVAGQPLTFNPPTINFKAGDIASSITITAGGVGTSRIAFSAEGAGAAAFSPKDDTEVTISPGTISLTTSFSFNVGGQVRSGFLNLNTPALNGFSIIFNAPGLIITPPIISFAPGAVSAPISANITASGINGYYSTTLSGPDAGLFTNPYPNPQSYSFNSGAPSVTAATSNNANTYLQQIVYFYLGAAAQVLPLTITPTGAGLTFVPASISIFDPTITIVSVNVYAATAGSVNIFYTLSGPGAQYYTIPSLYVSPVVATFYAYPFTVTNTYATSLVVGITSNPFVISVPLPASTVPTVWITPMANLPGIDIIPPVLYINSTTPSTSFAYRSNLTVGNIIISFALSGPGASAYLPIAPITGVVGSASFLIPSIDNTAMYNPNQGGYYPFVVGVNSPAYTIYARSVPAEITIQLVSDQLDISPNILTLKPTDQRAYFNFVPKKVGAATIAFLLLGNNTALYTAPPPITGIFVGYNVQFPTIPNLRVGETSESLKITISPPPLSTYILTIPSSTTIIFSPSKLVFTPGLTTLAFQVTALAPTIFRPTFNTPGGNPSGSTGSFVVTASGSDGIDGVSRALPIIPPVAVLVTPGTFTILHPRYQLDVETKISISISGRPRSDVIITLLANNINFKDAPYAIFTKDGPTTQELVVTPRHTTSYELDYASFKVDYILTGSNAGDYFAPSETLHYIAIPMGYIAAIILVPLAIVVIVVVVIFLLSRRKTSTTSSVSVN